MPDGSRPGPVPGIRVGGAVDDATRCEHWNSSRDVVAFQFKCCGDWYACRACHDEATEHETQVWGPGEAGVHAVLCGVCSSTMTIDTYLACAHVCPFCGTEFNPNCRDHWDRYFEVSDADP